MTENEDDRLLQKASVWETVKMFEFHNFLDKNIIKFYKTLTLNELSKGSRRIFIKKCQHH